LNRCAVWLNLPAAVIGSVVSQRHPQCAALDSRNVSSVAT
jgi:hypothetical protein